MSVLDTKSSPAAESAVVRLQPREIALVGPELDAFIGGLRDDAVRDDYRAVAEAVAAGEVRGAPLERLQAFLELALTTGRVRQRLGLHAEDTIRRVYERTPRGVAQVTSADDVTRALASLIGQPLQDLRLSIVRTGTYRLIVETDQFRVSVGLAPAGAHVESVEATL